MTKSSDIQEEFFGHEHVSVIEPPKSLFELRLREVWAYRDLLYLLVRRDFVAQYKQTVLGPAWHVIQPLFTTIIFTIVFGRIAKIPTDGIPPFVFFMAGTTLWAYFSQVLTTTANTFIGNANIFGKVYFPRLVMPLSNLLSKLIAFAIQFAFLALFIAWYWFVQCANAAVSPVRDRCFKSRLWTADNRRRQRSLWDRGQYCLGCSTDRGRHFLRNSGDKEMVNQRNAEFDRVSHACPVAVAQELIAHVGAGFQDRHTRMIAAGVRRQLLLQVLQGFLDSGRIGGQPGRALRLYFPRHEQSAPKVIGARPGTSEAQQTLRFGMP